MTPKEKAEQLINKYQDIDGLGYFRDKDGFLVWGTRTLEKQAKQCALITVNECFYTCIESMIYYWEEVKKEIENN